MSNERKNERAPDRERYMAIGRTYIEIALIDDVIRLPPDAATRINRNVRVSA